jgi:hypothetical protein
VKRSGCSDTVAAIAWDLHVLADLRERSSQALVPLADPRRRPVPEQCALDRADGARLGQRAVLEVCTDR